MLCVLSSSLEKSSLRSDQRDYVVFMCKHSTLAKPLDFIQDQHSGQTWGMHEERNFGPRTRAPISRQEFQRKYKKQTLSRKKKNRKKIEKLIDICKRKQK